MHTHDSNEPRVLKHALPSRLFHWSLVLGFVPAAITGFIIWLKPGGSEFVHQAMQIHIIGAAIFSIASLLYFIFAFDRVIAFIRLTFTWEENDFAWLKVGGGYPQKMLLGKEIPLPPVDKMHAGQKQFALALLPGALFLIFSGWILYAFIPFAPKAFIYWLDLGHLWIGVGLGLFMFAHIFLGIYNWGEFKTMFGDGTQSLSEAKHHTPLWVETKVVPKDKTV